MLLHTVDYFQRKHLSQVKQQQSIVCTMIGLRIRLLEYCTTETRFNILPAQSKLSEQTSLLVSRERDKQLRIRQVHNCSYLLNLNTQLKPTTAIQLQLQC